MIDHKDILDNRISPVGADAQGLSMSEGEIVFALQDRYHQFSMELSTILQCLRMAEQEGGVPRLPSDWWIQVARRYAILLD